MKRAGDQVPIQVQWAWGAPGPHAQGWRVSTSGLLGEVLDGYAGMRATPWVAPAGVRDCAGNVSGGSTPGFLMPALDSFCGLRVDGGRRKYSGQAAAAPSG